MLYATALTSSRNTLGASPGLVASLIQAGYDPIAINTAVANGATDSQLQGVFSFDPYLVNQAFYLSDGLSEAQLTGVIPGISNHVLLLVAIGVGILIMFGAR